MTVQTFTFAPVESTFELSSWVQTVFETKITSQCIDHTNGAFLGCFFGGMRMLTGLCP